MAYKPNISVCICTYKRPEYLHKLILELEKQCTEGLFTYDIVVVDNDIFETGKPMVKLFAQSSNLPVSYYVETEQNIALARNKAVENSKGEYLGFIDDDEVPITNWLIEHYRAITRYNVDGILGPVLPAFEQRPPKWVLKGHFFDRPVHPTGHILDWENTRTGNALLKRTIFEEDRFWFDPKFGSGGEDRDFFRRKIETGKVFAWCNEAPVYEIIPVERWRRSFMIKRALLRGKVACQNSSNNSMGIIKSLIAIIIYMLVLPMLSMVSHHIFMDYLIKSCDHLGKILSAFGIDLVKTKYLS